MHQPSNTELQLFFKALSYIRTHWWLFVLGPLVILTISLYKFHETPNVYDSYAEMLIDTSSRQMYRSVLMPRASYGHRGKKENMVKLLLGDELLEQVSQNLQAHYDSLEKPAYLQSFFLLGKPMAPIQLRHGIKMSWDGTSDSYKIRCIAPNPNAARDLCTIYLSTVKQEYPAIGQREIVKKLAFLKKQIDTFTRQIAQRELDITDFEKNNKALINFLTVSIESKNLQELRKKTLQAQQDIDTNRALKRLIQEMSQGSDQHEMLRTTTSALSKRLSELSYKHHLTKQIDAPNKYERLASLEHEISLVSAQLDSFKTQTEQTFKNNPIPASSLRERLSDLELQFHTDKIKLAGLTNAVNHIELQAAQFRNTRLEYNRLQAELEHKKNLLVNLYKKEQETEIELSAGSAEIFKLREPTRSGHRIAPQLSYHIFGAISVSIFFCVVALILLIAFFPRIDNEQEVQKLDLSVLGKIPVVKKITNRTDQISPFALEYLKIMNYRILRETKDKKCPVIIVSSPQPGDGKSTVTLFLNRAAQSPKRKSLFIDGDLITAHANSCFGIPENATPGLKSILTPGGPKVDPEKLIVKTQYDGIYFLPRGGKVESVASPNFINPAKAVIESMQNKFDMIFIDTPPLFTSNLSHQWAGLADLIVLVARVYVTRPKDLLDAVQTCKIYSKAPVGIALNCLHIQRRFGRSGYYYYYFSRRKPYPISA